MSKKSYVFFVEGVSARQTPARMETAVSKLGRSCFYDRFFVAVSPNSPIFSTKLTNCPSIDKDTLPKKKKMKNEKFFLI
jgi:hypothetical protein